jgi:putative transport protein
VWFLSSLAPKLLKVDLKAESRALETALATGTRPAPGSSAYREWDLRAFRIGDAGPAANRTVWEFEQSLAPERVFVERVRKGGAVAEPEPGTRLAPGDAVVVGARRHVMLAIAATIGPEIEDRALLDFPLATVDVVLTDKTLAEHTLAEVAALQGRGVVLSKLIRGGDLLSLSGAKSDVERAGHALGYIERPSGETDVVFVGLGILVGGLFGLLTVTVGSVPLSLTASGGALVMGLVFGWLRSVRPTFGRIPAPALWVFDSIGLAVFIGVVGLSAGPSFVTGLQQMGPSLLLVGFVVAMTPHVAALLFGRYILKMNPVILFGACAGAGTVTAALRSIQDEADSKLPVLGYTVPYAIGNLLLTAWGPVIVMLTQ